MKFMIASSLILLSLSGCETASPVQIEPITRIVDTFCSTYVPVYTSKADTEKTKLQVDKNNAVWYVRCDPVGKAEEAARLKALNVR